MLVRCTESAPIDLLGRTLDDAAGEAFDKVAKLLGCPIRAVRRSIVWQNWKPEENSIFPEVC